MALFICVCGFANSAAGAGFTEKPVYVQGVGGYNNYRIPALLTTQAGTLLAFCEGREGGDSSDIDMLVRRSEDGGKTWSRKLVIWDEGRNVAGNPCPVQDTATGVIWLLMTWNDSTDGNSSLHQGTSKQSRLVFVCHSADDGRTWTQPEEVTASVKKPDWMWYATGPGVGIQLRHAPYAGRLVIPCDFTSAEGYGSHVIYSDDHGKTWELGGSVVAGNNECQAVELADGTLMLNARMQANGEGKRGVMLSKDGGDTWPELQLDPNLPEPVCQGSILRYSLAEDGGKNRLLFSNPASPPPPGEIRGDRVRMTVRLSYDEGKTWPVAKLLHEGPSAYSCLAVLPDGDIGCLYEGGDTRYGEIVFARFSLAWLTDGEDKP